MILSKVYEDAERRLERNEITLGEFERLVDIEVIEPKRGEWIEQEDCWQCSECGNEYVLEVDVKPIDAKMHFCPNCGADMRKREGE